jgi:hypothetical protein
MRALLIRGGCNFGQPTGLGGPRGDGAAQVQTSGRPPMNIPPGGSHRGTSRAPVLLEPLSLGRSASSKDLRGPHLDCYRCSSASAVCANGLRCGIARATAPLRVWTPVRLKMFSKCLRTVATEMNKIRAMSALL